MSSVRQAAASIYRILIALFAVAVVVEIFPAGLGAFHAINAFLILGLSSFLTWQAWRGQLLVSSSQLPAPDGPQGGHGRW